LTIWGRPWPVEVEKQFTNEALTSKCQAAVALKQQKLTVKLFSDASNRSSASRHAAFKAS